MSDHDPLCWKQSDGDEMRCTCLAIAEVRADERERIAQAIEATMVMPKGEVTAARFFALGSAARIARNGGRDE